MEEQLDDHYLCTDIDRMENIARQVLPLSAMERPAWDTKVLESLGVCSIRPIPKSGSAWSEEETELCIDTDVSGACGKARNSPSSLVM